MKIFQETAVHEFWTNSSFCTQFGSWY